MTKEEFCKFGVHCVRTTSFCKGWHDELESMLLKWRGKAALMERSCEERAFGYGYLAALCFCTLQVNVAVFWWILDARK